MKRLFAFASCVLAAVMCTAAFAAKTAGSLTVNPAAPTAGQQIVFSGCGYRPDRLIGLGVENSAGSSVLGFVATTDAAGCFATDFSFSLAAGSYRASTFAYGRARSFDGPVIATVSFVVW